MTPGQESYSAADVVGSLLSLTVESPAPEPEHNPIPVLMPEPVLATA